MDQVPNSDLNLDSCEEKPRSFLSFEAALEQYDGEWNIDPSPLLKVGKWRNSAVTLKCIFCDQIYSIELEDEKCRDYPCTLCGFPFRLFAVSDVYTLRNAIELGQMQLIKCGSPTVICKEDLKPLSQEFEDALQEELEYSVKLKIPKERRCFKIAVSFNSSIKGMELWVPVEWVRFVVSKSPQLGRFKSDAVKEVFSKCGQLMKLQQLFTRMLWLELHTNKPSKSKEKLSMIIEKCLISGVPLWLTRVRGLNFVDSNEIYC